MNDIKIEKIDVNCPARPLSEDFQEYFDKLYGRPCTDMYDFEFLTLEECEEKGLDWGWKSKKKENITEDQKIKKHRKGISFQKLKSNVDGIKRINLAKVLNDEFKQKIIEERDKEILEKLLQTMKSIYPEIVAEQLTSVQPIASNIFNVEKSKEEIVPEFYQQIIDKISSMKTNFHFIYYDNRSDEISGHITLNNFDTYITNKNPKSKDIRNYYFDMYKKDIDSIKNTCKNYNVNIEFKLLDMHCFCSGWCNVISMTIKRKDKSMDYKNDK